GGQRIALTGSAGVDLVVSYLATIASGNCAVPLPTSLTSEALGGMVGDCEPALAFTAPAWQEVVAAALAPGVASIRLDADDLSAFIAGTQPLVTTVPAAPDAAFNIIYSSGTTGRPKGIVHGHAMRERQATRALFGLGAESTMLLATPLYSNTTL